jgi:hypothetical protein
MNRLLDALCLLVVAMVVSALTGWAIVGAANALFGAGVSLTPRIWLDSTVVTCILCWRDRTAPSPPTR